MSRIFCGLKIKWWNLSINGWSTIELKQIWLVGDIHHTSSCLCLFRRKKKESGIRLPWRQTWFSVPPFRCQLLSKVVDKILRFTHTQKGDAFYPSLLRLLLLICNQRFFFFKGGNFQVVGGTSRKRWQEKVNLHSFREQVLSPLNAVLSRNTKHKHTRRMKTDKVKDVITLGTATG